MTPRRIVKGRKRPLVKGRKRPSLYNRYLQQILKKIIVFSEKGFREMTRWVI